MQAYADLDAETRSEIDQLQLITYNPFLRPFDGSPRPLYRYADQPRIGQGFPHPLVRTHPESGRHSLFLSDKTEVEVLGYSDTEGAALVERLRAHLEIRKYAVRAPQWFGISIGPDGEVQFAAGSASPWEQSAEMDEVTAGLPDGTGGKEAMRKFVREARSAKVGRNDPCPCGSGKKYKKCCLV